jgi:hypothetical protein
MVQLRLPVLQMLLCQHPCVGRWVACCEQEGSTGGGAAVGFGGGEVAAMLRLVWGSGMPRGWQRVHLCP